jgi:phenylacetaldehyde dehydrogenase
MTAVLNNSHLQPEVQQFLATSKKLLINGEWVEAQSGRTFDTFDPATARS